MATENNWLTHNLYERIDNKNSNFDVEINVQKCKRLDFEQASKEVCEKLYALNNNIYVGLSGGIDSEYVFRRFHFLNIPFTPVIVYSKCYDEESSIAFNICKEYNITPKIINIDEKDIISIYKKEMQDKLNTFGIGSVPSIIMANYAKENGGIYVKAEHMVGDKDNKVCAELNEWDFYNDVLNDGYTYDFFLYTPEIVYSMLKEMLRTPDIDSQNFKCNLYKIPYRKKIINNLSNITLQYFYWTKSKIFPIPNYNWNMNPKTLLENHFYDNLK